MNEPRKRGPIDEAFDAPFSQPGVPIHIEGLTADPHRAGWFILDGAKLRSIHSSRLSDALGLNPDSPYDQLTVERVAQFARKLEFAEILSDRISD